MHETSLPFVNTTATPSAGSNYVCGTIGIRSESRKNMKFIHLFFRNFQSLESAIVVKFKSTCVLGAMEILRRNSTAKTFSA